MSLALRKEDFDFEPVAPSVDWQREFKAVESVKDFVKVVDKVERDSLIWRAQMKNKFETGLGKIRKSAVDVPAADVRNELIPMLHSAVGALESAKKTFSVPFHDQVDAQSSLRKISSVSGAAGRLIRKQFDRIENIRVAQYNACVDLYYIILAFQSEYEEGAGEGRSFESAEDLEAFLMSQVE
jgi:hypothetical protein